MNIQYNKAFTIIELMLTVLILAVIVGMATPSFIQTVRKNQLNRVASEFVEKLNKTRSNAILYKKDQSYALTGDSAWTPDSGVEWHTTNRPTADIKFDIMGRAEIVENFQCFILQNSTDNAINKIIVVHKNGTVNFESGTSSCPTTFAGGN